MGTTNIPITNGSGTVSWDGTKYIGAYNSNLTAVVSYDGAYWIITNLLNSGNNPWRIYYNNKIYILIFFNYTGAVAAYYSYDGINWSSLSIPLTINILTIAWNGLIWLAGGQGTNTLAYSYDGINWIQSSNGNNLFTGLTGRNTKTYGYYSLGYNSKRQNTITFPTNLTVGVGETAAGIGAIGYSYNSGLTWRLSPSSTLFTYICIFSATFTII
jgi:hypothetical protein